MSLSKKSFFSVLWDFGARFMRQGAQFVISIVLTRLLSPEDFGLIGMVMVIIALLGFLQEGGLSQVLIQKKGTTASDFNALFTINCLISTILVVLLNASSVSIARFYGFKELTPIIRVLSLVVLIDSLTIVHDARLKKEMNFRVLGFSSFAATFCGGILGVLMALMNFGVWSIVGQVLLTSLVALTIKWRSSGFRPTLVLNIEELRKLAALGRGFFFTSLFFKINERLDIFLIGKFISASFLGYFTRAKTFKNLIIFNASTTVNTVLFPLLARLQDDEERYLKYVRFSYGIVVLLSGALTAFLLLASETIFTVLFGTRWLPSVKIFNYLAVGGFFSSVSRIYYNILRSKGKGSELARIGLIETSLNVGMCLTWILGRFDFDILLYMIVSNSIISYLMYFIMANLHIRWRMTDQIFPLVSHVLAFSCCFLLTRSVGEWLIWSEWVQIILFLSISVLYVWLTQRHGIRTIAGIVVKRDYAL